MKALSEPERAACRRPAAAATLDDLRPLVLRDHPLHLQQEVVLGGAADRVVEEDHLGADAAKLLDEQDLVGVAPREAIRGVDVEAPHQAHGDRVAQPLQRGAHEARPAVPLVDAGVLRQRAVALGGDPLAQRRDLAGDRVVARLLVRRHARIEGDAAANHACLRTFGPGWRFDPASRALTCR